MVQKAVKHNQYGTSHCRRTNNEVICLAPLTALFVSRDMLLIGAVFYLRYRTCPPPVTLKRYFDPTLVNAKLAPTAISKVG